MRQREFDVILFGATGFTGRQTVQYFTRHAPDGLRWAIAGRNAQKLEALGAAVPMIVADSTNSHQAADLASRTRVLLSTAGPLSVLGDPIVAACVDAGTHYVDITGETVWVQSLIERFHDRAASEGTRIIPFCGFDSVPADLGVSLLLKEIGSTMIEAKACFQIKGGSPNGGTVITGLNSYNSGAADRMRDPFLLSPRPTRPLLPMEKDPSTAAYDKDLQAWVAPSPMSVIDTRVVRRSCSLIGIDVAFQEFTMLTGAFAPLHALAVAGGAALLSGAIKYAFFRDMVKKSAQSGTGPTVEVMDSGWFRCLIWGRDSDGRTAHVTHSWCRRSGQSDHCEMRLRERPCRQLR